MIDYTRLRKKLIPEPDGEPNLILRTATVDAVNANGTVDLTMSSGVLIPGVPRLAGAYAPVDAVVQVLSLRGSLLVLGAVNGGPALGGLQAIKTGSVTTGPSPASTSFSTAVLFGVTFPAIPSVHVSLANNGASPTGQWIYHALNQSTTGFTLFGFGPASATFSALFRWSAILAP